MLIMTRQKPKVQEIGADNFVISWQDNRAGEYG